MLSLKGKHTVSHQFPPKMATLGDGQLQPVHLYVAVFTVLLLNIFFQA